MLRSTRLAVPFALAILSAAASEGHAQALGSRYTSIDPHTCRYLADSGQGEGDWISYRCDGEGGIPVWLFYTDSARLTLSFGVNESGDLPTFSADRESDWPVEWRGTQRGSFLPFAAIVRTRPPFQFDGDRSTQLSVFRVWRDRPACFLGSVATNEAARRLADRSAGQRSC